MFSCNFCGSTNYEENDGYLFCKSCCTQSQNYVDMEVETDGRNVNTTVLKNKNNKEILELTSWEEYNYVLVGLVNQLIELGAKEEVKLICLQLWTEYLRKAEVAFFSKDNYELPRLPIAYKIKDAVIMYDKDRPPVNKPKRKPTPSSGSARSRRKRQKQIIESDYNSTICSNTCPSNKPVSIPINFTRKARRILKKIMPKEHIKVHAEALCRPKCHKILRQNVPYKNRIQHTAGRIILSILYIALNQANDKIQLGDMVRWCREGHLSVMNIQRFFPDNYKLSCRMIEQMCQAAVMSHYRLRINTFLVLQFLNVEQLNRPDFTQLCRRYVNELELPNDVFKYAERLIRLNPPTMQRTQIFNTESVPNYEGRAMAYIVFVLKLIFGLDGTTEELLSDSAEQVNCKIGKQKIFNFRKWMRYVELRKILLSECHFPTSLTSSTSSDHDSHLYINHLNSVQTLETVTKKPYPPTKILDTLFEAMLKIADIHQINEDKKPKEKSFKFHPSLTPNSNYICEFLKKSDIAVPKMLNENFQESDLGAYLKKNSLHRDLCENYGISLKFQKINRKLINMNKNLKKHIFQRGSEDILRKFNSKPGWVEVIPKKQKWTKLDRLIKIELQTALNRMISPKNKKLEADVKVTAENAKFLVNENNYAFGFEPCEGNLSDSEAGQFDDTNDFNSEPEFVFENDPQEFNDAQPNRDLESNLRMFDDQSEDELSDEEWIDAEEQIEFYIPNFHYWRRTCHIGKHFGQHYEKVERELPKSFNWLIHECARLIENKPHDLYTELLTIETGFISIMKPLKPNTTRVKFRNWSNTDISSSADFKYINYLRLHW